MIRPVLGTYRVTLQQSSAETRARIEGYAHSGHLGIFAGLILALLWPQVHHFLVHLDLSAGHNGVSLAASEQTERHYAEGLSAASVRDVRQEKAARKLGARAVEPWRTLAEGDA